MPKIETGKLLFVSLSIHFLVNFPPIQTAVIREQIPIDEGTTPTSSIRGLIPELNDATAMTAMESSAGILATPRHDINATEKYTAPTAPANNELQTVTGGEDGTTQVKLINSTTNMNKETTPSSLADPKTLNLRPAIHTTDGFPSAKQPDTTLKYGLPVGTTTTNVPVLRGDVSTVNVEDQLKWNKADERKLQAHITGMSQNEGNSSESTFTKIPPLEDNQLRITAIREPDSNDYGAHMTRQSEMEGSLSDIGGKEDTLRGEDDLGTPIIRQSQIDGNESDVVSKGESIGGDDDLGTPILRQSQIERIQSEIGTKGESLGGEDDLGTPLIRQSQMEGIPTEIGTNGEVPRAEDDLGTPIIRWSKRTDIHTDVTAKEDLSKDETETSDVRHLRTDGMPTDSSAIKQSFDTKTPPLTAGQTQVDGNQSETTTISGVLSKSFNEKPPHVQLTQFLPNLQQATTMKEPTLSPMTSSSPIFSQSEITENPSDSTTTRSHQMTPSSIDDIPNITTVKDSLQILNGTRGNEYQITPTSIDDIPQNLTKNSPAMLNNTAAPISQTDIVPLELSTKKELQKNETKNDPEISTARDARMDTTTFHFATTNGRYDTTSHKSDKVDDEFDSSDTNDTRLNATSINISNDFKTTDVHGLKLNITNLHRFDADNVGTTETRTEENTPGMTTMDDDMPLEISTIRDFRVGEVKMDKIKSEEGQSENTTTIISGIMDGKLNEEEESTASKTMNPQQDDGSSESIMSIKFNGDPLIHPSTIPSIQITHDWHTTHPTEMPNNKTIMLTTTDSTDAAKDPTTTTTFNPHNDEDENETTPAINIQRTNSTEQTNKPILGTTTTIAENDKHTSIVEPISSPPTTSYDSPHTTDYSPQSETLRGPSIHEVIPSSTVAIPEKRAKFIGEDYKTINGIRLTNTSDAWNLIGLKPLGKLKSSEIPNSVEAFDDKFIINSTADKNLYDWSQVMLNTGGIEPETTFRIPESEDDTIIDDDGPANATAQIKLPYLNEVANSHTTSLTDELSATKKLPTVNTTTIDNIEPETKFPFYLQTTTNANESIFDITMPTEENQSTIKTSIGNIKTNTDVFINDNQLDGNNDSDEHQPDSPTVDMRNETIHIPPVTEIIPIQINNSTTAPAATSSPTDFNTDIPVQTSTRMALAPLPMETITTSTSPYPFIDETSETLNGTFTTASTQWQRIPGETITIPPAAETPPTTAIKTKTTSTTITSNQSPQVTTITTTEPFTPTTISSDTMTQTTDNDVSLDSPTSTKITSDSKAISSTESTEQYARINPVWTATTPDALTTETHRFTYTDVSTEENSEINNAYNIATPEPSTTISNILITSPVKTVSPVPPTTTQTSATLYPNPDHIDSIQNISDTGETSIESNVIDQLHSEVTKTTTTTSTTTTAAETTTITPSTSTLTSTSTTTASNWAIEDNEDNIRMPSTGWSWDESTATPTTSTPEKPMHIDISTTMQSISPKNEDVYSILPTIDNDFHVPKVFIDETTTGAASVSSTQLPPPPPPPVIAADMDSADAQETDVNVIIAISVSAVGIAALILLVAFLYVMRKRQKQMSYGQRCRPVSLDAYSLDNVSVYNSVRRKAATLRASKRSYGNVAFDDPSLRHNILSTHELAKFVDKRASIWDEFRDVPQIIARSDEVPSGCDDKNRYANVIPLPETRVILHRQNGDERSEYINANYVRGPKDTTNYYIACQAPLENTVGDFWRMIWEQNSRVIIMATDLNENGIDKCAEYLPPSVTLDNHTAFGNFQVTLKNREVKEKYAVSMLMLKNTANNESREITHYWYQWPEAGVPTDEAAVIAMLLEARSSLKAYTIESELKSETIFIGEEPTTDKTEINGNITSEKAKQQIRDQGPLTIHCSPGTGRTGTLIACDIAMRCLEEPKRCVDIPQIVYSVRRGRASAVQTKEQYEFIYKVTHMYATKISNINDN